jgi:hypothetical protein
LNTYEGKLFANDNGENKATKNNGAMQLKTFGTFVYAWQQPKAVHQLQTYGSICKIEPTLEKQIYKYLRRGT